MRVTLRSVRATDGGAYPADYNPWNAYRPYTNPANTGKWADPWSGNPGLHKGWYKGGGKGGGKGVVRAGAEARARAAETPLATNREEPLVRAIHRRLVSCATR